MPNQPLATTRPQYRETATETLEWQGNTAKSKVLSLIYNEHARGSLPVHPLVHPSYCLNGVSRYRVDFRDSTGNDSRILVSFRVVARVEGSDLTLLDCLKSDYRPEP